jgi:hypothetical protein
MGYSWGTRGVLTRYSVGTHGYSRVPTGNSRGTHGVLAGGRECLGERESAVGVRVDRVVQILRKEQPHACACVRVWSSRDLVVFRSAQRSEQYPAEYSKLPPTCSDSTCSRGTHGYSIAPTHLLRLDMLFRRRLCFAHFAVDFAQDRARPRALQYPASTREYPFFQYPASTRVPFLSVPREYPFCQYPVSTRVPFLAVPREYSSTVSCSTTRVAFLTRDGPASPGADLATGAPTTVAAGVL